MHLIAIGCLGTLVGTLAVSTLGAAVGFAIDLGSEGGLEQAGIDLLAFAVGVAELVLLSLLLRYGVRRWTRSQPPDPPRAP